MIMVSVAFIIIVVLALLGMPIALAFLAGTVVYFVTNPSLPNELVFQAAVTGIQSFPLLAIAFFILMGELMNAAGMTKRLIRLAENFVGHMTGGLAQVNVVTNTLMGGVSGSSTADAAVISKTLVPEMVKRGYDRSWASALTASASVIGPIIPPGIGLILFGYLANVSISQLFIGGIVPGVLLCFALMGTVYVTSKRRGYPPSREKIARLGELWSSLVDAAWALTLPVVIVGGIRLGIFTHTEAAAIAVVYAMAVGFFIYREMKPKDLAYVLAGTVRTTAIIMLIIGAASAFGRMLAWERIPNQLAEYIISFSSSPYVILLVINISLLIIGMFSEGIANLIIMTPLLMPVVEPLGIDPVAFGVMMVLNLTIGGITPPLGTMMYTVCALNGISTVAYTRHVWPFILTVVAVLLLITYVPGFVTVLPSLL